MDNKIWTKSLYIVPGLRCYSLAASVTVKNEKYIIFFGKNGGNSNDIMIWDRNQQKLLQSKIKCPMSGRFNATLVYDDNRDELLTFGFINECFRSSAFEDIRKLPHYLIQLIRRRISIEYVHLLFHRHRAGAGVKCPENNHWKINVDHLLASIV